MTRTPSTGRILKNDYSSLLMLMFIGVTWILAIAGGYFGFMPQRRGARLVEIDSSMAAIMIVLAVVVTILFGSLASKRISGIKQVFRSGPEVKGRIQDIAFVKDRGRVEYEYEYNGQTYQAGNAIWKNKETRQLQAGDKITVIVDPDKPSRAFIASLYT